MCLSDRLAERLAHFNRVFFFGLASNHKHFGKSECNTSWQGLGKKIPSTPLPLQNHKETTQAKLNILFVCLFLPKKEKPEYLCSPVMTFLGSSWEPEGSDAMATGRIRSAAGALTPLLSGKTNENGIALPPDCLRQCVMQEPGWVSPKPCLFLGYHSQTYSSQGSTPRLPGFGIYCLRQHLPSWGKNSFFPNLCVIPHFIGLE